MRWTSSAWTAWMAAAMTMAISAPASSEGELPPERPTTPYHATIRNTFRISEPGGGSGGGDTVEIRVSGARLFEDSQIMEEKIFLVDTDARVVIEFVPEAQDKVATRLALSDAPIPYIHGRAALVAYDREGKWGSPKIAGKDRVAKHACTILHFGNPAEDGVAACVSKEGVVLRARIVWPGFEREFEALDFDPGKQDEKWFRPPEGYRIVDG